MTILHRVVAPFDSWGTIAIAVAPGGVTQSQLDVFAEKIAIQNGSTVSTPLATGRVIHIDDTTIPAVIVPPSNTVPTIPFGLTAVPGDGVVNLSWTAPLSNGGAAITDYQITRNGSVITDGVSTGTTYTDTGRTNGTPYTYTVKAQNSVGLSAASEAAVATPVAPTAPSGTIAETFATGTLNFTSLRGGLTIAGGVLRPTNPNEEVDFYHNTVLGSSDHEVSAKIIIGAGSQDGSWFAINARMANDRISYYSVEVDWSRATLSLLRNIEGSYTRLATWTPTGWAAGSTHTVKLICAGTTISVLADGVQVMTAQDSGITTGTRVGVHCYVTNVANYAWDDFVANTVTVVPPPAPSTGNFYTASGKIGRGGKQFVPIGVNGVASPAGSSGWWNDSGMANMGGKMPGTNQDKAEAFANLGFNFVRFNCWYDGGSGYSVPGAFDLGVYNAIDEYTARGVVCMPAWHGFGQGFDPTLSWVQGQTEFLGWLDRMVTRYKDNPLVWINPLNEPYGGNPGAGWLEVGNWLYARVRAIAPNMMFVYDLPQWGQNIAYAASNGPALVSGKTNVVCSFHNYAMGAQTAAINAAQAAGVPIIIGEYGETLSGADEAAMIWVSDNAYTLGMGAVAWWGAGNRNDTYCLRNATGAAWYDLGVPLTDFGSRLYYLGANRPVMPNL